LGITLAVFLPEATMDPEENDKILLKMITRVRRMNKSFVSSRHTSHLIALSPSLRVMQRTEPPKAVAYIHQHDAPTLLIT
jgi:hypothetical protein